MNIETREAWLHAFTELSRPHFERVGHPLPEKIRNTVGFTSGGKNTIGQCWYPPCTSDGATEIIIHLGINDDAQIADALTHELVHAASYPVTGHGAQFKRIATALGLTGKMTATVAGDAWREWALPILEHIGPMPRGDFYGEGRKAHPGGGTASGGEEGEGGDAPTSSGPAPQKGRYHKVVCTECGWTARVTRKHIDIDDDLNCPVSSCDGVLRGETGE